MKQNQLYLISTLKKRIKKLEKLAHEPQNYKEKCTLKKRIKKLEKLAHEPQNYKEKCDEMEKRIEALESELRGRI